MSLIFNCFDSIQIFKEIASLSFQVSWTHQFLTDFKKILDFVFFPLGLFGLGAWFPFDKGQSIVGFRKFVQNIEGFILVMSTVV